MTTFRLGCLLRVAACLLAGISLQAQAQSAAFGQLPVAVQKTVRDQAGPRTIGEVSADTQDGEARYTVTLTQGGTNRDVIVAEDGRLCSAEISLDDAPPMARATIKKTVGDGALESVAISFGVGKFNYDVMMTKPGGMERSFTVELDGTITTRQVSLRETPFQARAAIKAETSKLHATLEEVDWTTDEDGVSYDVDVKAGDQERDFSVLPTGKIDSIQIFPAELPPASQQTLNEHLAGGKLARVDMEFDDDGSFIYHVQVRARGKISEFYINPAGGFQLTDDSN